MTPRNIPTPLYGVTIDNANGIGKNKLNLQLESLAKLPHKATIRVVFDEHQPPGGYDRAIDAYRYAGHYIVGELLDSESMKQASVSEYIQRTKDYVGHFGDRVDGYEVSNETNGNWLGPYSSVAQKFTAAYDVVKAAGQKAILTLWYNDLCGNGPSEDSPESFSIRYVPAHMKTGLDYVLVSYYETQCGNRRPTPAQWKAFFERLHMIYPNSRLGMGEIGFPRPIGDLVRATSMANFYYKTMPPQLGLSYYVEGNFWWYFAQDCVPVTDPFLKVLASAMV